MAETPKDETRTGKTDSPIPALAETLEGGAAPVADDTISGGDETASGDDAAGSTSVSAGSARDHVTGGAGNDDLSSDPIPGRPWSSTASGGASAASASASATGGDDPAPSGRPTAKPEAKATGKGGASRVVVPLILVILVIGVAYATYPDWRERAAPYAAAVGIDLPALTAEESDVADAQPAPAAPEDDGPSTAASAAADQSAPAPTPAPAPAPTPPADPAASAEAVEALAVRLSAAEAAIAELSARPAGAPAASPDDLSALDDRLAALEQRLTGLGDEMAILREGIAAGDSADGIAVATSALGDRLADLDTRMSALEQAEPAPAASPADLAALATRLDALATSLDSSAGDLGGRLDALAAAQQTIADRQSQGRSAQERAGAFLLAANLLAATASGSGDFSAELNAVEAATAGTAAAQEPVAALKDHAGGVPSRTDLRVRFPSVAAAIIDASIVGADDGVVGTALTRIASLVTLRRTETAEGDAIDAIVNRAEAAADAGDLTAAVEALAALDGDPAKVAEPWLAQARARIAVDGAVHALQSQAIATVSGG